MVKRLKNSTSRTSSRKKTSSASSRPKSGQKATKRSLSKAQLKKSGKAASTKAKPKRKVATGTKKAKSTGRKSPPKRAVPAKRKLSAPSKAKPAKAKAKRAIARPKEAVAPPPPPRKPTREEAGALRAFERAHREFARGHFDEARMLFRVLLDKHPTVAEVVARARTYLAVAESRLRSENSLPRDADSLYDRGVIELNRGEYVAAQEMFERALKREPEGAHIHYGLAATRARLGSLDSALESLRRALALQPSLRVRAQHDQDLTMLRTDPDFEQLIFSPRP